MLSTTATVRLKKPHSHQLAFIRSDAKRKVIRAGRRGGKTVGLAILAVEAMIRGRRVLYATPTQEQITTFWFEVSEALRKAVEFGVFTRNLSTHTIEQPHTKARIRAKTAWNADTLRGDYADVLIFDEYQLMNEDAWQVVGAPMLLDNNGDAIFIYTPPSYRTAGMTKAHDPKHAAKLFAMAQSDKTGRWQTFHFTSHENPYISEVALEEIKADMKDLAYRQEILAEDVEEVPGALWTRQIIENARTNNYADFIRIVVGVDPSATATGDETGIVVVGLGADGDYYVIGDASMQGTPTEWANAVVSEYNKHEADCVLYESNQGGDMAKQVILNADSTVAIRKVHASRGKHVRAEPVSLLYEQGKVHHVGYYATLEDELCTWIPGQTKNSPNRLDALVHAITDLHRHNDSRTREVKLYA